MNDLRTASGLASELLESNTVYFNPTLDVL